MKSWTSVISPSTFQSIKASRHAKKITLGSNNLDSVKMKNVVLGGFCKDIHFDTSGRFSDVHCLCGLFVSTVGFKDSFC